LPVVWTIGFTSSEWYKNFCYWVKVNAVCYGIYAGLSKLMLEYLAAFIKSV
jgi:hypothetical protein